MSSSMIFASPSGVEGEASLPLFNKLFLTSGLFRALTTSRLMRSIIGFGVFEGANNAYSVNASYQ